MCFFKKMSAPSVRLALVVDPQDKYDESAVQVIDLVGINPIGDNIFIIQTVPFDHHSIANGAGHLLTSDQKNLIISSLTH